MRRSGEIEEDSRDHGVDTTDSAGAKVTKAGSGKRRLQQLIDSNPVMLFMKGTPEEPKCKFSKLAIDMLKEKKIKFGSFDVLVDNEVMEGIQKYSNWPVLPQLSMLDCGTAYTN
ncbi:unnamed protein product [Prunus armeniaca]